MKMQAKADFIDLSCSNLLNSSPVAKWLFSAGWWHELHLALHTVR